MKNLLTGILIIATLFLSSCDKPEYKYTEVGTITSLRIDDDGQYHFSTDNTVENDVSKHYVFINRGNYDCPTLILKQERCPEGKTCESTDENWSTYYPKTFKINLPNDFKIETFDD